MPPLDPARLRESLRHADFPFRVESIESCDSTNACLLARAADAEPALVLVADQQTAGRGRLGRTWESTPDSLTFSILWRLPQARLGGLSLAVGLALLTALEKFDARHLALKWPNDLLFLPPNAASGKLAGILVELAPGNGTAEMTVVIGIGLNLLAPRGIATAAGLVDSLAVLPSREKLLAEILIETKRVLNILENSGFAALREQWQARHAYQNRAVCLQNAGQIETEGICRGVDEEGALLLEIPGKPGLSRHFAGDLSLRLMPEGNER